MVLNKRILREFKNNWLRYTGLFFLVALSVSVIIGFAGSTDSIMNTVEKAAAENRLEDGNFQVMSQLDAETMKKIENKGFVLAEDFHIDAELEEGRILRLFPERTKLNLLTLVKGNDLENDGDIIIDSHFGESSRYDIGSTLHPGGKSFTVKGYGITPEYTLVIKDNSDLLADPENFGIGFVTKEAFLRLGQENIVYGYSFRYKDRELKNREKDKKTEELKSILKEHNIVTSFYKTEDNQRTTSYADDVAINKSIALILGTILLFLLAFIISLSILHIIDNESPVIGALYALGYVKKEIACHFMLLPVILVTFASLVGTGAGFAVFTQFVADSSYQYYSYPNLHIIYPVYLILFGIAAPIAITAAVNFFVLSGRLRCTPLKLLRKDTKKDRIKALKLKHFKFITKFRIRVFLRGLGNNLTLFTGLIFSTFLLLMGFGVRDSIHNYVKDVTEHAPSRYIYILKQPVELDKSQDGEKAVTVNLTTHYDKLKQNIKITLQGIQPDSRYLDFGIKKGDDGLYISRAVGKKFGVSVGDILKLEDSQNDTVYNLKIAGMREYTSGLYVFMDYGALNEMLGNEEDYYNTYFSNENLNIKEDYIYSRITSEDMGKVAENMSDMMKSMISMLVALSVILYIIIMYLLLKMIIDKNASNISLIKIFGYNNGEINKLYLGSTFYTVLLSVLAAIPLDYRLLTLIWPECITNIQGFIFIKINLFTYFIILLIAMASYLVTHQLLKLRLKKISFADILKNRE